MPMIWALSSTARSTNRWGWTSEPASTTLYPFPLKIAATMFGSTETTFYVVAVYFGAVNIKKTRHAIPAGLIADVFAMILAVYVVKLLFG